MARRWTVGEQLGQARRRRFVGRRAELELFAAALSVPEPPFTVLHVYGPGGVGKTALLQGFAEVARAAGALPVRLDARHCEPTPAGFMGGLRQALKLPDDGSPIEALADSGQAVLLVDTYETAAAADDWLRDELLPRLPAGTLIVLAGREPPTSGWRADPGWGELLRVISLRNLPPEDSRAFLRAAGIPETLHADALACSHGHPLALTLLVDVLGQQDSPAVVDLAGDPHVVRVLVERFTATAPSPHHQQALEACALVRAMTESLLRIALQTDEVGELFMWLRSLSFVEESAHGLILHDLARDVLGADLRWRDPTRHEQLRSRLQWHLADQIPSSRGDPQHLLVLDALFMHRLSPQLRGAYDWGAVGSVRVEVATVGDRAGLLAMVRRHEGEESAGWAEFWLDRQPAAFSAFRGLHGALLGFCCYLPLHEVAAVDRDADPGTRAAWTFVQRHDPARPGEHVTFMRFGMDAELYQRPSPAFNLRAAVTARNWFSNPRLAWDVLTVRDPYLISEEMDYLDYHRAPEADFTVGGHRFIAYAHDWRRRPLAEWTRLIDQRGASRAAVAPEPDPDGALLVLSQPEFADSVRAALREVSRPALLAGNPLCRSRLVHRFATGEGSPDVLATVVRGAVEALRGDARDMKLYRALDRTYLRPAPSQERAAEVLGLPFSTYRRHLAQGVARVISQLWHDEVYPDGPAAQGEPSSLRPVN
ncbi:MAG: AAA family ATPase [Pseudonocardiaceae bacterium]